MTSMGKDRVQLTSNAARTRGEVKVWLTAAGLASGLAMISALLLLIAFNGLRVFWPDVVVEYTIRDDSGAESQLTGVPVPKPARRSAIPGSVPGDFQVFTGNKDVYRLGFRYLEKKNVVSESTPKGIRIAERLDRGGGSAMVQDSRNREG